jgi:hypothetical protein
MIQRTGAALAVLAALDFGACHGGAPATSPAHAVEVGALPAASDDRCEDEPLGALHTTDPGYLIGPEQMIAHEMDAHRGAFLRCVAQRRQADDRLGGKVVVRFRVDARGVPSHVVTRGPDPTLDGCVCRAMLEITFDGLGAGTEHETSVYLLGPAR